MLVMVPEFIVLKWDFFITAPQCMKCYLKSVSYNITAHSNVYDFQETVCMTVFSYSLFVCIMLDAHAVTISFHPFHQCTVNILFIEIV